MSVTLREAQPDGRERGYIDAKVEPSVRVPVGVYVFINDHYEFDVVDGHPQSVATDKVLDALQSQFEPSVTRSVAIADGIIGGQ